MAKYPTVDLRGRLAGSPVASQGTVARKTSITMHYNGPAVSKRDVEQLMFDAEYHKNKNWGTSSSPAYTNGIQYEWAVGSDGTKYRLRNPRSILWHCAVTSGNAYSYSITFLIGEGQRITNAAREGATELVDELRAADGISKSQVFGHKEWSSTACPGSAQDDFVVPYRQGRLASMPPEKTEKWAMAKYNFISGSVEWGDPRCEDAVAQINERAGKTLAAWAGKREKANYASQKAYESEPAGRLVCVAVGTKAVPKFSSQAKEVFGKYPKSQSDLWDGTHEGELTSCIREIARREGLDKLDDWWIEKYGGQVMPPKESGGENASASGKAAAIDRYFAANYSGFGPYSPIGKTLIEEADRAGLALNAACALVEQESGGRNIFGGDHGNVGDRPPFYRQPVTQSRVQALRAGNYARGMNGVGTTQLTWYTFVEKAEALGGAHIVRNQMRVGFELLAGYMERYGRQDAYGAYNAGEARRTTVRSTYSASCLSLAEAWKKRLG